MGGRTRIILGGYQHEIEDPMAYTSLCTQTAKRGHLNHIWFIMGIEELLLSTSIRKRKGEGKGENSILQDAGGVLDTSIRFVPFKFDC